MSVESNSGSFVFTLLHFVKKTRATLSANQNKTRRNHDLEFSFAVKDISPSYWPRCLL